MTLVVLMACKKKEYETLIFKSPVQLNATVTTTTTKSNMLLKCCGLGFSGFLK